MYCMRSQIENISLIYSFLWISQVLRNEKLQGTNYQYFTFNSNENAFLRERNVHQAYLQASIRGVELRLRPGTGQLRKNEAFSPVSQLKDKRCRLLGVPSFPSEKLNQVLSISFHIPNITQQEKNFFRERERDSGCLCPPNRCWNHYPGTVGEWGLWEVSAGSGSRVFVEED